MICPRTRAHIPSGQVQSTRQSTATPSAASCRTEVGSAADGAAGAGNCAVDVVVIASSVPAVVDVKLKDAADVLLGFGMLGSACR